jgi:hypothetical protein
MREQANASFIEANQPLAQDMRLVKDGLVQLGHQDA